jgi:hypothetical protein
MENNENTDSGTHTNNIPEYIYRERERYAAGETSTNGINVMHLIAWENITERYRTIIMSHKFQIINNIIVSSIFI